MDILHITVEVGEGRVVNVGVCDGSGNRAGASAQRKKVFDLTCLKHEELGILKHRYIAEADIAQVKQGSLFMEIGHHYDISILDEVVVDLQ